MSEGASGATPLLPRTGEGGPKGGAAGFTLMEAMLAVALMAAIVMALATIAAQWLPNWRRGFVALQRADLLSLALERMSADISAAEYVTPNGAASEPLFDGRELSVTFVRSAFGPDSHPHLEVVRLAEVVDDRGFAIVRTRAPFTPLAPGASAASQYVFADPVVLTRAPFRVSFAYAGPARTWQPSWGGDKKLPSAVRITVRDSLSEQVLAASTAALMKVTADGIPTPTPSPQGQPDAAGQAPAPGAPDAAPGPAAPQPSPGQEPQ